MRGLIFARPVRILTGWPGLVPSVGFRLGAPNRERGEQKKNRWADEIRRDGVTAAVHHSAWRLAERSESPRPRNSVHPWALWPRTDETAALVSAKEQTKYWVASHCGECFIQRQNMTGARSGWPLGWSRKVVQGHHDKSVEATEVRGGCSVLAAARVSQAVQAAGRQSEVSPRPFF
jgi:hypothetical protein